MRIVAISGKIKSGKTTVATFLDRKFQRDVKLLRFAAPLKEDLIKMGIPRYDVEVRKPAIVRRLMQVYGQAQRFYNPDHWASRLDEVLIGVSVHDAQYKRNTLVVIDDMRFPNELEMLAEFDTTTVRLVKRDDPDGPSPHADDVSETALDDAEFDVEIFASHGQTNELCDKVLQFLVAKGVVSG